MSLQPSDQAIHLVPINIYEVLQDDHSETLQSLRDNVGSGEYYSIETKDHLARTKLLRPP